jgi:hypothetical protein
VQGWAGASRGRFLVTPEVVPDLSVAAPSFTHVPAGVQKTGESEFLLWEEVQSNTLLMTRIKMPKVCKAPFSLKVLSEACLTAILHIRPSKCLYFSEPFLSCWETCLLLDPIFKHDLDITSLLPVKVRIKT